MLLGLYCLSFRALWGAPPSSTPVPWETSYDPPPLAEQALDSRCE